MMLEQIPPHFVCQVWTKVAGFLSAGLEYSGGEYSLDQLQFMLVRGEQALLVATDDAGTVHGAATVAIEVYPAARIAFVTAVGGRRVSTPEIFDQLAAWCKANGCTKIRGAARESIARLWQQKFDFEQRYIIMEKSL